MLTTIGLPAGALLFEAAFGYPDAVFRAVRHPVVWAGALITWLDRRMNVARAARVRRAAGVTATAALLLAAVAPAILLQSLPRQFAWVVLVPLASTLLAQRSLYAFVSAVGDALRRDGLPGGRAAVAHIVGRNPAALDEAGVIRAAIESLAENFSDGVVAPALWCALAGLPGIAAYKAVNTADSMIGNRSPRHEAFGWAAARLDDALNLPASRLSAVWLVLAAWVRGVSPRGAMWAVACDAGRHRSPNAGWPEAAMAGALGLRLAGPRIYGETRVDDAWMGDGRADATLDDLARALSLYRTACGIQIAAYAALALVIARG